MVLCLWRGGPYDWEAVFLELPYLNAESFQLFIDAFAQAFADRLNRLLLDNSGAHTAQRLILPANVRFVCFPPYCPELNPIEGKYHQAAHPLPWSRRPSHEDGQPYHRHTALRAGCYPRILPILGRRCPTASTKTTHV
jgi:DDE superfamily endonuclease